jgi:hypothetical protein
MNWERMTILYQRKAIKNEGWEKGRSRERES